ncbi:conserved hypothetical protein [Planktothrix serta PCC 8927]|uniref:Uncharacterized protein n=1 Tax=Planktothrix serta PCC 8927 TaxID=671068 RepID=A0A7Z9BRH9_9CYAN|nr:conserved hypothetical protein [Planktothrix serta PCC 8927]
MKHFYGSNTYFKSPQVEISYNPYQGLKLSDKIFRILSKFLVEISYNPYQGLKQMNFNKNTSSLRIQLKSAIIPIRD